jgi:UDP-glucuronate 4-epimerase
MKLLVTGVAGFIGMHTALRLLDRGNFVVGFDNLNDYYDPTLKLARLGQLEHYLNFSFVKGDLTDVKLIDDLFYKYHFDGVIHLAAQAGVRYSVTNPGTYADSNLTGFLNVLEGCRKNNVPHLVYASSSSVYGDNKKMPFSEFDSVDHPVSLYAATKRANELMAHSYSHLYGIPVTGLRFFTVYGPWGRPDQSLFLFVRSILNGDPINVFNGGKMLRDFTYIDDIVGGVVDVLDKPAKPDTLFNSVTPQPHKSLAPYRIFNIGNGCPVSLMDFIEAIEKFLQLKVYKNFMPMQQGDMIETFADTRALDAWVGPRSKTSISVGVVNFIKWYKEYYEKKR